MSDILTRLRTHVKAKDDEPLGIAACFGKSATIENDGRTVSIIATTDDIDLTDEVVVPNGANDGYFRKNGKVFLDHHYDMDHLIGGLRDIKAFTNLATGVNGYKIRTYILPGPAGDAILSIVKEIGIGASIGFRATDYGRPTGDEMKAYSRNGRECKSVVRRWDWLETSLTAFPCNVACQGGGMSKDESRKSFLDEMVRKSKISREGAYLLGLKEAEIKPRVRVVIG